jgi:hypothetical protein
MSFKPYYLQLTGDPEVDDRLLSEYQKNFEEWKEQKRVADEAAEVGDLMFSFVSADPKAYAEAFDAVTKGKKFSETFEAIPTADGKFKIRLRRGTIQ